MGFRRAHAEDEPNNGSSGGYEIGIEVTDIELVRAPVLGDPATRLADIEAQTDRIRDDVSGAVKESWKGFALVEGGQRGLAADHEVLADDHAVLERGQIGLASNHRDLAKEHSLILANQARILNALTDLDGRLDAIDDELDKIHGDLPGAGAGN